MIAHTLILRTDFAGWHWLGLLCTGKQGHLSLRHNNFTDAAEKVDDDSGCHLNYSHVAICTFLLTERLTAKTCSTSLWLTNVNRFKGTACLQMLPQTVKCYVMKVTWFDFKDQGWKTSEVRMHHNINLYNKEKNIIGCLV